MNKKELLKKRRETWFRYKIPSMSNLHRRKINVVFLSPANSWRHEQEKCRICYELQKDKKKFITEAQEISTGLRRDVVCLDNGIIYEVEISERRARRFEKDPMRNKIEVVKLWEEK